MNLLAPTDRATLLDSLRPPAGFSFDAAVATTYSLHLEALLTAPLAFALYDAMGEEEQEAEDTADNGLRGLEPITVLESVRRYAGRMVVFCQTGQIAVPAARPVLAWLEEVVVEVSPPAPDGVFHPKIWLIRYRRERDGARALRFLCLSRNLTFDRSWDTVLRLDSHVLGDGTESALDPTPLQSFLGALPGMGVTEPDSGRTDLVTDLAADLATCAFALPQDVRSARFWPLGVAGWGADPLPTDHGRSITISPFVTPGRLAATTTTGGGHVLVSRPDELDRLPTGTLDDFDQVFVLSPDTDLSVSADEPVATANEVPGATDHEDDPGTLLTGLHAKVVVFESPGGARVLTGSANATTAAFGRNVEFVTELDLPSLRVKHLLEPGTGESATFARLLQPYTPPDAPVEPSPLEQLEDELDGLRRQVALVGFRAEVQSIDEITYQLYLRSDAPLPQGADGIASRCWPVTMTEVHAQPLAGGHLAEVTFASSLEGLTSFFVIELRAERDGVEATQRFVVNAPLSGAPENRHTRIIAAILRDPGRFVRYLLLLLGDPGADDQLAGEAAAFFGHGAEGAEGQQDVPVFEILVRALARHPGRLDHIANLVDELAATEDGRKVLPPGFEELWQSLWTARKALTDA